MRQLKMVDRGELTGLIRQVLGRETVELCDCTIHPIAYGATNPVSGGVYRVIGTARDSSQTIPWSVILKVVRAPEENVGRTLLRRLPGYWPSVFVPTEGLTSPPMFWKREVLAYQSGLLGDLPRGLAAPRCFSVMEKSPTLYRLWLEDIKDTDHERWTLSRYREAARHLGQFNGAYLAERPLPTDRWLASDWMRSWLWCLEQEGGMERVAAAVISDPLMRQVIPHALMDRLRRLWDKREVFLLALDRLPRVLCHRDAFPANLFLRRMPDGREEMVAVDWAFVGVGPIGEDLAPLVAVRAPAEMGLIEAPQLEKAVFEGYVHGLRETGWEGDVRLARLGYAASVALRYGCLTAGVVLLRALDPVTRAVMEERRAQPIDEILEQEVKLFTYALGLADDAESLIWEECTDGG
jgi:hypothetical protein